MDEDKISVISIESVSSKENQTEGKQEKDKIQKDNETSPWNICHVFSVLAMCLLFLAMVTLVPRTNSILYQSHWYEINFCVLFLIIIQTANDAFCIATYLKAKSVFTFWTLLKIFSLYLLAWSVPYFIAYLVWCHYLNYNWPIPFLGYNYVLFYIVKPAMLWASLPRDLCRKEIFQQDFKSYILYSALLLTIGVLRDGMAILFKVIPGYLQWIIAFLIPILKSCDKFMQSNLVNKMAGGLKEESQVFLGLSVLSANAFFIAMRLPNAEKITVCFIIAIDFFCN